VETARAAIKKATGKSANVGVISYDVYKTLKDHPDIAARVQYGGSTMDPARITVEALAAFFDLEELHVMGAVEETVAEGDTSSMAFVNRNKMLLCHRPKTPGFQVAAAGYLFSWQGYIGLESPDMAVSSFHMPQ
jgi:hypothetical protein